MPLAFDTRARVCGMGVERDLDCIFIGTVGPNHQHRTKLLEELRDVVTVMPPVYGREYFKTLARAKVVVNVHAEWSRGAANNMRLYEAAGMGCNVVSDGQQVVYGDRRWWRTPEDAGSWRQAIRGADDGRGQWSMSSAGVLFDQTYESRIPQLVSWARSL